MYCPNCGTQNKEGAKFCANCGEPLENQTVDGKGAQPEKETTAQPEEEATAQAGEKAASGTAHQGFLATTSGKVVLAVVIAAAAAGGIGGGVAIHHSNQVKAVAAREAGEAARDELLAEIEADEAQAAEEETVDAQEAEAEVEEIEAIPVTDDMYPELLEGGLTKLQFEEVIARGPETMTNGSMTIKEVTWFAESLIRNTAAVQFEGAPQQETAIVLTEKPGENTYSWCCNLDDINDLLSVLTDYRFNAGDNETYRDLGTGLSVEGDELQLVAMETSSGYTASITDTSLIGDEIIVTFERTYESLGSPEDSYDKIQTAILKQTDTGRYRVDTIMDGTIDTASDGTASHEYDGDYILPGSDSTYLSRSDLEGLSSDELRLARNELYARHGRKFDDPTLQEYFNSKDWYNGTIDPNDFSDESMLNNYEVANRDLILAYESEIGSGSAGASTGTASGFSDTADTNITGTVREIYEQVLKDVRDGKYDYSAYDIQGDTYQYFLTDMNGDGIMDLAVAKKDLGTSDAGWSGIEDDCLCRVFTVTSKGDLYALQVVNGTVGFIDAFYAGDGNGFYAEGDYDRANGNEYISRVTIQSGSLSEGNSEKYFIGDSSWDQFEAANARVTWYDASDLSGLNGL